ncbi:MAG: hypothetical protein WCD89_09675 [Anaerocolumna sp.]
MKRKYKKVIVVISIFTLGIGMLAFTVKPEYGEYAANLENSTRNIIAYQQHPADISQDNNTQPKKLPIITIIPRQSDKSDLNYISEAVEVNKLEKDAYEEINKLIEEYFNAKLKNDVDSFKPLVNDIKFLDMEDNARKTQYIEAYKNITCYTKQGLEEGTLIVYAYYDVKFTDIETLAPGMDQFFIKENDNGGPYIYFGEVNKVTAQYLKEAYESEEVMDLVYKVNQEYEKVAAKDSVLSEFKTKLEEAAKNVIKYD